MKRTIDIMTTARAKGAELPGEWWNCEIFGHCPSCPLGGSESIYQSDVCGDCGEQLPLLPPRYIGPNLELPENIHHAFTVADALGKAKFGVKVEVLYDPAADVFEASFCGYWSRYATERHLALIAACEAALGIQHEKEIAT